MIIHLDDETFRFDTQIEATQALEALLTPPSDDLITAHPVRSDKHPRDDCATPIDPIDAGDASDEAQ